MAEGIIKKLKSAELQNWEVWTNNPALEVYPVTATSAVFNPKTNQSLDDILASINTRIIQAAASGGGGTTTSVAGLTYIWAFAGFKGDSDAVADMQGKANHRGIPPGWQESSNVDLQDGEMLYMTTARKQGDKWLTWEEDYIWSAPVRLGSSGTTSGTGSDGQGYNYIYCRTSTGVMPSFQMNIEDTTLINAVEEASKVNKGILVREAEANVVYEQSTDPTNVWYDHPDGVTATIPYEWILVYQGNKDEWVPLTLQPILWSKYGVNGQDGDGVEYVFCTVQDTDDAPTIINNNTIVGTVNGTEYTVNTNDISTNEYYQQDDFIPNGWYDQPQEVSQLSPKQYVSIRKKKWVADEEKSKWGLFTEPKIWSEIPIVVSGLDKLSIDWSNDNVNVVTGESGASLEAATDNYLTVKLGDTLLPYLPDTFDNVESNSYKISNVDVPNDVESELKSYQNEVDEPAQAHFYITSLPGTQRLYTIKFTIKVRVNGTVYTQYSTINIYVKDVAYELVVFPKGFNLSAIDTKAQQDLTVQVKMRNATTNRFLTGTEINDLGGDFQYKFIKDGDNSEQFVNIIPDETTTLDQFTIDCTSNNILDKCRAIEIKLTSSDGYEDSETIMIARDGNTGDEGNGIEYIFYLATEDIIWVDADGNPIGNNNPSKIETDAENFQQPNFVPTELNWTDDLREVTESNPVQYVSVRRFKKHGEATTKSWGKFEPPVVYNRWVPSPYSMSISNDSVIIDDNTDSITLANASFCQLHIFSGQDEITTNSEYTFEITPLANNGANGVFQLHIANQNEIDTINNNETLTVANTNTWTFGSEETFDDHKAIAFYLTIIEGKTLSLNSYGIQYKLDIFKSNSKVASLYKVQPIKVANFSADGTIYKLNITNDTWTYNGDTGALIGPASSTVTVAEIKGATATQKSFNIGNDTPESHPIELYVKTSSELVNSYREGQLSHIIAAKTAYPGQQSSYSLELYFNRVLVDAETIDCRKDGKTGEPGKDGIDGLSYYLTCDNDNIIIDSDTTNSDDIEALSTYNLQLWKSGEQINTGVNYEVELLNNAGSTYHLEINDSNARSSYFQISSGYTTLTEGSFQAKATALINNTEVASKIINVIIKQLKGTGVSYKLMVSPNTLLYEYDSANTSYSTTVGSESYPLSRLQATVVKISEGEAINIPESNLENHSLVLVKPDVREYSYSIIGYDFALKLKDPNTEEETIVDKEHVDCILQGTNGIDGKNGDTLISNANMYVDLSDPDGPSLNINANFYAKDTITSCYIYWGDRNQNTPLVQVRTPNSTEVTVTIKIPYQYIASSFNKDSPGVIYTKSTSTGTLTFYSISDGWGTCTHITLVTQSKSGATDTKVIYRTGTEGYYFDNTSNHFISTFSKAENIHPQVTDDTVKQFTIGYISSEEGSQQLYQATTLDGDDISNTYIGDLYIKDLQAAIIKKDGTIVTNPGFTLINDNTVNNIRTIRLQPTSIQKKTVTDTVWNSGQNENILQVDTVLCNQWILYYNKEISAIANQDYVVSFYMRLTKAVNAIQTTVKIEGCNGGNKDSNYSAGILTTTWKRFFIKGHNDNNTTVRLVMGANTTEDFAEVVTFELGGFQITRGSDLASWAPYSGETMSVLLQTSKEFNSTVSQVTANKTNISTIQQQANNIQVKVNKSGLEVTDTGTTFTGDVKANNFTVINNDKKPIMEVLVATTKIELENGPAIESGEPYIRLTQYGDLGTPTYKYVGLYSLQNADTVDALTYNISTIEGYPLPTLNPQLGISLEGNSTTYYQLKDIRLLGKEVTTGNPPINNGILWCEKTPSSSGIQLTYTDEQYKVTGGTAVSEATTVTTYIRQISNASAFYVLYDGFWYQVTDILYGDRIYITNDTTLKVNSNYVCVECSLPLSVIPDGYHWAIYQANAECRARDPNTMNIIKRTEWFELVNSREQSSFLGFNTITPIT